MIERLIGELSRGRTYAVPYSVVVNKVVDWKVVEFFSGERESPLPENWDAGDPVDPYGEFEQDFDLEASSRRSRSARGGCSSSTTAAGSRPRK